MLNEIYNTIEGEITGTLSGKYSAVVGLVSTPLQTAMAINLVLVGYAVMRGVSNEPFGNYLGTWLKCYLVILAATSSLATQIASAAQSAPDQLASALGSGSLNTSFDTFIKNVTGPAIEIHNAMPLWHEPSAIFDFEIPNLFTGTVLILVILIAYIVASIAMAMVLFVKFGLFVTIATMPIFVGALIFPSSSGLFFSWLGAVLNYAIQTAAISLALVFVMGMVESIPDAVSVGTDANTWAAVGAMCLQLSALVVGAFLILQAQSIGSFAGGGGSSGAGFLSAIYPSTLQRAAVRGAGRMATLPGRATGSAARWSLRKQSEAQATLGQAKPSSGRTTIAGASSRAGNR